MNPAFYLLVAVGVIGIIYVLCFKKRKPPTVSSVAELTQKKVGTEVFVRGRISRNSKPIRGDKVCQAVQQYRGPADWLHVRQRRGLIELDLSDGTIQVENDGYSIVAKEPVCSSSTSQTWTQEDGRQVSKVTLETPNGKLFAQWDSAAGVGTLRRVALKPGDEVTILAKISSGAKGLTLLAKEVLSPNTWEWLEKVDRVPVMSVAELRAAPQGTAVCFYAQVATSNPLLKDDFVAFSEEEFQGADEEDLLKKQRWEILEVANQPLALDFEGSPIRVINDNYAQLAQTRISGSMSFSLETTSCNNIKDYKLTLDHNGLIQRVRYDEETKKGTHRFWGIKVGDWVRVEGKIENRPDGVGIKARNICVYYEEIGFFNSKPLVPEDKDMLDDSV